MRLLFVADPLDTFKVAKDSTLAMMRAASAKGHEVWHCQIDQMAYLDNAVRCAAQQLNVHAEIGQTTASWYTVQKQSVEAASFFDVIVMRKDPPFDVAYLTATWMLSQAEKEGVVVLNNPQALRDHSEKLALLEFIEWAPPTIVTHHIADIRDFHQKHRDIIIKPLDGMGGMGVFRIGADALNLASIVETLGQHGQKALMVQRFIPEISEGDKRVLLIDGKAVPYALARIPQAGEVRGNLAAGGQAKAQALTNREKEVVQAIGSLLASRGLHLVGLDFIGGYLTEINVTSPTCFVEITQQTGHDVAIEWLSSIESKFS